MPPGSRSRLLERPGNVGNLIGSYILVSTESGIFLSEKSARARSPSEEYSSLGRPPQESENYYGILVSEAIPSSGGTKLQRQFFFTHSDSRP
jgi:hypothetical protein